MEHRQTVFFVRIGEPFIFMWEIQGYSGHLLHCGSPAGPLGALLVVRSQMASTCCRAQGAAFPVTWIARRMWI
ncbi:hypothetical protein DBV15_01014 [Temnothorax longispinosus]|uniref:Uncharacterized protein n=1 Tax=Temnothorax longispinosus TaxID=300112 RepID=A0A4S2JE32_9HYME|nr:hypothetical protein DBV15_01014 [Temnothorax longispinosus]